VSSRLFQEEGKTMTDEDYEGEEEESPCDYGADSPCVEPALRNMGNCFECWLYREMCEDQKAEQKKKEAHHE
jgi:hypothetical protein